jgi:hypothetical protein
LARRKRAEIFYARGALLRSACVGSTRALERTNVTVSFKGNVMAMDSTKGLLIAILSVSCANLVVNAVQTGVLLRSTQRALSSNKGDSLPAKYTPLTLVEISKRITEPYNRNDIETVYDRLDDYAKSQVSREKLTAQIGKLKELIGDVKSASYAGYKKLPGDGAIQLYLLSYTVQLTGGQFPSGIMQITVLDRPETPGIVGFFINGFTQ